MLPLDEPHFEIDTNTRAIKIPDTFKKNGIAVQSDDLAEVVYFKVDRYYDYMDLNNCDIYIQWETPKSKTTESVKAVSPAYIRDISSEPGKLIFGWAISDAITGASGNLKFSVRFFQWADEDAATSGGEKVLAYSLSTLTATVAIQPGIEFNPETDEYTVDEVSDRLLERLQNSEIAGGIAAAKPEFYKDLDDPNTDLIYDLDAEAGTYALLVQAFAADTGAISYTWKYQELSPENTIKDMPIKVVSDSKVSVAYIEVNPENMDKRFRYYWGDSHIQYDGNIPPTAEEIERYEKFYVKQSQCLADAAGDYWVVAENRITNSVTPATSKTARFPRPEAVVISKQPVSGLLTEDATGESVCKVKVVADNTDGVLSYQWQKSDNYSKTANEATLEYTDIEGATMAEYEADEQGRYRVRVTNTRNKETSVLNSDVCRITNKAAVPVVENELHQIFVDEEVGPLNCPTITLDDSIDSDKYIVEWYVYEAPDEGKIKTDVLMPGSYISKLYPKAPETLAEIQKITGDTDIIAKYYAIITNEFNGSTAVTEKPSESNMMEIQAKANPVLPEVEEETED